MRKGTDVPIEEANLILELVNPPEVAPGIHQAQQKEPGLLPRAVYLDEHLEEGASATRGIP